MISPMISKNIPYDLPIFLGSFPRRATAIFGRTLTAFASTLAAQGRFKRSTPRGYSTSVNINHHPIDQYQ